MLWVSCNNFIAANVPEIVLKDVLGQQIDQRLNVHCHVLFILCLFQLAKVQIVKSLLEKLDVKGISKRFKAKRTYAKKTLTSSIF